MQSAKRVTLVPPEENQFGGGSENNEISGESGSISSAVENNSDKIKSKIYDKIHRFIKVILKLARTTGYDENLRIKLKNGDYLEKSNIVDLLTNSMSMGKVLHGEKEFIELLASSDVDPDLIINDNVRLKLIQFKNNSKKSYEPENRAVKNSTALTKPKIVAEKSLRAVKKGNKKFIVVNEDGATVNLSPKMPVLSPQVSIENTHSNKRKIQDDESDEEEDDEEQQMNENSVDDEMIDKNLWRIRKQ